MLNIGPQELLLILVVALVIVGPRRLPEVARSVAGFVRSLRAAQDEVRRTVGEVLDPALMAEATGDVRRAHDELRGALGSIADPSEPRAADAGEAVPGEPGAPSVPPAP